MTNKRPQTPPAPTAKALAEALGISTRRISQLKLAGMPCNTIAAAVVWRKKEDVGNDDCSPERLRKSRIHLLDLQAQRQQIENDKAAGLLMPIAEVRSGCMIVCSDARAELMRFVGTVPPILAGLSAPEICKILRAEMIGVLTRLSDNFAKKGLGDSPANNV